MRRSTSPSPRTVDWSTSSWLLPIEGGDGSTWRLVQLDPADGTRHETGIAGTAAAAVDELAADISADVGTALVWVSTTRLRSSWSTSPTGHHVTLARPAR